MSETYYKKVGKRYEEVGMEFTGFPANGVWLVKDGSHNCIMKMDDIGKKPIPYIDMMKHRKDIMDSITYPASAQEIVDHILEYVSNNIEWEKHI